MNLPESLLIQCACGTIIKIEATAVTLKEEVEDALKQMTTDAELQDMVRDQLCSCGHMAFIHSKSSKSRPCVKSGCTCVEFKKSHWLAPAKT